MRVPVVLALMGLAAATFLTDRRVQCFMQNFYELVDISADVRLKANEYLRTADFAQKRTLGEISLIEFFDDVDFKLPEKINRIILNINQMNDQLRRIIENCFPPSQELLRRCQDAFPEDGCELFDGFVAARSCQRGFFGVDWVYCVPHCPSNYDEDPNDPFVCRKTESSNFSFKLALRHGIVKNQAEEDEHYPGMKSAVTLSKYMLAALAPGAPSDKESSGAQSPRELTDSTPRKELYEVIPRKRQILSRSLPCPEGYLKIGADICIRQCPFGWSDYGDKCEKPLVRRRDYELFFYTLDIDGKENQVEPAESPEFEK